MSAPFRTSDGGAWIDRAKPVSFAFEGREYAGFAGDTLSSALWANGVRVLGRSFKYHRPRGVWGAADVDCNVMVDSATRTNLRGDITPIAAGLDVHAVNTRGGVDHDKLRFLDHCGAFTPVGFYYKAFHSPKRFFRFYEERMRAIAGLGTIHPANTHTPTPKAYAWCDVLVVGSGPAGLSAALAAADAGASVILIDEQPHAGGSLLYDDPGSSRDQHVALLARVEAHARISLRLGTQATGLYADRWIALVDRTRLTKCRAGAVIVCSGAYEQPAVFRHNDLPGIMLASGALRLLHLYGVLPCRRAVVFTSNDAGYRTALQARTAGIEIAAIVDFGEPPAALATRVEAAGIALYRNSVIREAQPAKGLGGVAGVVLASIDTPDKAGATISCDGVLMSVGYMPADGLIRQAHGQMVYDRAREQFVPGRLPEGVFAAGRVNGIYDLADRITDGRVAGLEAAHYLKLEVNAPPSRPRHRGPAPSHPFPIVAHEKGKNFVDLDEDLQLKDFKNAVQEGYDNPELLKRYSTVGMGPSQGKHSNLNALRILTALRGESMADKQLTTARPFVAPVPLSHLAGRSFLPRKHTPLHCRHVEAGAAMMVAGVWWRPEYYARPGLERLACIREEALAVRQGVGLIDVGTLGKIEVCGPDATALLEAMYTGRFATLAVGATRYGVVCDETGVVIDDGMIARLAPTRFYVSTTTSGADRMYRELQRWVKVLALRVTLVNVTNTYGGLNVAGPKAREVLAGLTDLDLSAEAFPYLAIREGRVAGVPARLSRVGFVGEWGYEIHAPADGMLAIWDALMAAGQAHGIRPFGVEAQRLLRLEKGHVIISQDTDGLTDPYEAGLGFAVKLSKGFFVGQRSLKILKKRGPSRVLVGFELAASADTPLPKECHLVLDGDDIAGRVTSIAWSPALQRAIGLAYVRPSQAKVGTAIVIRADGGRMVTASVCAFPFYDPAAARQQEAPR